MSRRLKRVIYGAIQRELASYSPLHIPAHAISPFDKEKLKRLEFDSELSISQALCQGMPKSTHSALRSGINQVIGQARGEALTASIHAGQAHGQLTPDAGPYHYASIADPVQAISSFVPSLSIQEARQIVAATMRASDSPAPSVPELLSVLTEVQQILFRAQSSASAVSYGRDGQAAVVSVVADLLPEGEDRSMPEFDYEFHIRVFIKNIGVVPFQVLARAMVTFCETTQLKEVPKGTVGVLGQQPLLQPGESLEYHFGTSTDHATTGLCGSFQMLAEEHVFEAVLPTLVYSIDANLPAKTRSTLMEVGDIHINDLLEQL